MTSPSRAPHVLAHCPVCHVLYPLERVQMLHEHGASRVFHCSCASCGNAIMAVVMETESGVSSMGMVTDLEVQDAVRFYDVLPISADDCVVFHRSLETNEKAFVASLLDKRG